MSSSGNFHEKPFDEGTETKLQVFELYAREWLPVFLSQPDPPKREIHLFDFFSGPGEDSIGHPGSPLRLIRQLRAARMFLGWPRTTVVAHFYDSDAEKVDTLRERVARLEPIPGLHLDIDRRTFRDALTINAEILQDRSKAKLLFIDQFGVEHVDDQVFLRLVNSPTCDFLFFLSSWTLHRFHDHPAIKQKISRPDDHYHVHRAAVDYYRGLLSHRSSYFLAPFSIKKASGIYGIIFGSAHPRGMDKFLQVAWKKDEISGEADFDIDRDNIQFDQPKFDIFQPTKVYAFEQNLEAFLCQGLVGTENEVMQVCFRHGVKRQHSSTVLARLKKEGVINLNWRVPDIERWEQPRPLTLI